jgi:hypothetical protein
LARANVEVGPEAGPPNLARTELAVPYAPDARILAEAPAADADFFVTHDQAHFLDNIEVRDLPCQIGLPGDALNWLRERLTPGG